MLKKLPFFFSLYLILVIGSLVAILFFEKGEILLWINQNFRTTFSDKSMVYITFLGDGFFFGLISLGLILRRWRVGVLYAIAGLTQLGLVAFFKRIVFSDFVRPKKFFEGEEVLTFIDNVEVASYYSFPSGHSAAIFLLTGLIALTFNISKEKHFVLLLIAILVGFSRIYLLQHFFIDVVGGSVLGVLLALVVWFSLGPKLLGTERSYKF